MEPLNIIVVFLFIAILFLAGLVVISKANDPPAERRRRQIDRRRRFQTARHVDLIAEQHAAGAITTPQAIHRLRDLEIPIDTARRVLQQQPLH